jgi:hypothetical protein
MKHIKRFAEIAKQRGFRKSIETSWCHIKKRIIERYFELRYGPSIDIINKDWDNLILLDAYRYDYFKEYSIFEGELSYELSKANCSYKFMKKNFSRKKLQDTVYLTANPHAKKLDENIFYATEFLFNKWDSEIGTVPPDAVTQAGIRIHEKYPNKRLIIHYMQPHDPHLGSTAESYRNQLDTQTGFYPDDGSPDNMTRYPKLFKEGKLSEKKLKRSYVETIQAVEKSLENLLPELTGKTVISSDHGENLGERKYNQVWLEHSNNTKECRLVPWLELPFDQRKDIIKQHPTDYESPDREKVQQQLKYLGYR